MCVCHGSEPSSPTLILKKTHNSADKRFLLGCHGSPMPRFIVSLKQIEFPFLGLHIALQLLQITEAHIRARTSHPPQRGLGGKKTWVLQPPARVGSWKCSKKSIILSDKDGVNAGPERMCTLAEEYKLKGGEEVTSGKPKTSFLRIEDRPPSWSCWKSIYDDRALVTVDN